jgi:hypothetical protein
MDEILQGEVIEREQFWRWFALTGAHIQEFSDVEAATQAFKIFVEGPKGLQDINAIEAVERLRRTPKDDGVQQCQRLVVASRGAPWVATAAGHHAEFPQVAGEEDHDLVRFSQRVRP